MAETDVNQALYQLDDYLSRVDNNMQEVSLWDVCVIVSEDLWATFNIFIQDSDDENFETVRELPAAKRVKLVAESKEKEAKEQAEEETDSEDYTSDSD